MIEEVAKALAILEQAMQIEQEGREFYLKAAETTQDEKGKQTFRTLAQDEQSHFRLIRSQRDALARESKWVFFPEVKVPRVDWNKPLFPAREALEKAISPKSGDKDAVLFGLGIESKSWELYRQAAQETGDPLGKGMFEFLAGQEKSHFETLMMRYDFLSQQPIAWNA